MGFNIAGIAINKNYKNNFEELQNKLGWKLRKQKEITFQEASSNAKEPCFCDVYFSDKGTLLFISMPSSAESIGIDNANTLTFAMSETAMAFSLSYCENGIEKRSIIETNDRRIRDSGDELKVEENKEIAEYTSLIIWKQMEVVLGKSFWKIGQTEKAERYVFT